jgi:hypothetical protein
VTNSLTLGATPAALTLVLSRNADFVASLTRADGTPFPDGSEISIVIDGGSPLTGTITGPTVSWEVDEAVVGTIIAASPKQARMYYELDETKVLWATGSVVVR